MPALEVTHLRKHYGSVRAVDDVSFSVERGKVFGLLGPNGSGKTTTLACALGLMRPSSGRVQVLGVPADRLYRTRGKVGVVFDAATLVRGLTVRRQIAYAARLFGHAGGRPLDEALQLVGLGGLESRQVTRLSLGQQKRLAVATALAGRPELLVLDEPLSGLDPLGVRDFLALLHELAGGGLTIVLSSHRLHELEPVLDHVAILLRGRLAVCGPVHELLGGGDRHRLVVDDVAGARAALERFEGLSLEAGGADGALAFEPGPHPVAELNRALVQAGVGVSELAPDRASLPALFESLVDELHTEVRGVPPGEVRGVPPGEVRGAPAEEAER